MSVSGIESLDRNIQSLPNLVRYKIARAAHTKASKVLIDAARLRVNFKTGRLNRSIGYETSKESPNEAGAIIVGPRRGKGFKGYHGHLLEYGHKTRPKKLTNYLGGLIQARTYSKQSGGKPGWVKAYPFMKPALELQRDRVLSLIKLYVAQGIEKYVNKMNKGKK